MKIAIPYAEEQVFQHFNEASQFKIYTVDEFDILEEELVSISQDTPAQTAAALKAQGVNVVICGNIGVASLLNLQDAKIQVMGGAYGAAREQVEKFLNGQLHFETKESRSQQQSGESNGNVSACGNQCFQRVKLKIQFFSSTKSLVTEKLDFNSTNNNKQNNHRQIALHLELVYHYYQ